VALPRGGHRSRDRIAAGSVGTPVRTRGYGIHAGWGPTGWFADSALAGGGALIDMGIHAIDTARFLLDDPLPIRVVGSVGTSFGDYDVDDDGVVLIEWSNGVRMWLVPNHGLTVSRPIPRCVRHLRIRPNLGAVHPRQAATCRLHPLRAADVHGPDARLCTLLRHRCHAARLSRGWFGRAVDRRRCLRALLMLDLRCSGPTSAPTTNGILIAKLSIHLSIFRSRKAAFPMFRFIVVVDVLAPVGG
jgi:hypothetical protein